MRFIFEIAAGICANYFGHVRWHASVSFKAFHRGAEEWRDIAALDGRIQLEPLLIVVEALQVLSGGRRSAPEFVSEHSRVDSCGVYWECIPSIWSPRGGKEKTNARTEKHCVSGCRGMRYFERRNSRCSWTGHRSASDYSFGSGPG